MNNELDVSYQDDVLADPIPGATWLADEPQVAQPSVEAEEVWERPLEKRTEVTKIAVVVVVGILGGTIGGITLAKYGIRSSPVPSQRPAAHVSLAAAPAASVQTPVLNTPPTSKPSVAESPAIPAPNPALVAASAVQVPVAAPAKSSIVAAQQVLSVYTQKKDKATEVIVFLAAPVDVKPEKLAHPNRLFFDLPAAEISSSALSMVAHLNDPLLKGIRSGRSESGATRLVLDVNSAFNYKYAVSAEAPYRLTITLQPE